MSDPIIVNGETFSNKWGPVQVQVTFSPDGTLTAVEPIQSPSSASNSIRINDIAMPRLATEALTAQAAEIDTISGATYTSDGYRRSLQSAIDISVANGTPAATRQGT